VDGVGTLSAELLRRAAAKMRADAAAATPSPWATKSGATCDVVRGNAGRNYVASTYGGLLGYEEANARHIASWHPVVALAVADWLDAEDAHQFGPTEQAINVARAYLGEDG
jgi:hypothetical protein